MRDFSTPAIILSKRRQGEADLFVDMISPDYGKFTMVAKGALKISSKFIGKLEIGQRGVFFIHKTTHNWLILKDVDTNKDCGLKISSHKDLILVSKIFELIKKIEYQPQLNQSIFALLTTTLLIINISKEHSIFLQIIMLNMLGYLPEFKECSNCQKSLKDCAVHYTDAGEIFCQSCKNTTTHLIGSLTFNQIKLLSYTKSIMWDIKKLTKIKLEPKDSQALELYADNIIVNCINIRMTVGS
ncbi:DNA repair protein RecO [Patescibacteria group bacterium]|nr:DNA repair protein RecO [Patescibacteria group bacterium]